MIKLAEISESTTKHGVQQSHQEESEKMNPDRDGERSG